MYFKSNVFPKTLVWLLANKGTKMTKNWPNGAYQKFPNKFWLLLGKRSTLGCEVWSHGWSTLFQLFWEESNKIGRRVLTVAQVTHEENRSDQYILLQVIFTTSIEILNS